MLHSKIVLTLFLLFLAALVLAGIKINQKNISRVYSASGYPSYFLETRLTNSLFQPTTMAAAPDGRLFVSEKAGKLRVIKDGVLLSTPFLTLSVTTNSERGLLGVAVDPNFTTNRFIYVYYTKTSSPVKNRVSRFTASASNTDVVETGSEFVLHDNIPSDAGNHQAGAIHFGLDGKLYIAVGDNGTPSNAQDLSKLTGKILRINTDGTIPGDNPFVGQSGKKAEIWAYGFRNPFTFAVDKSTGKIFINDVGSKAKEEINNLVKGANYGWPTCEGTCSVSGMTNAEYEYTHEVGQAIIGGAFYRGSLFPSSYDGDYFFSDYVQGWIKVLDLSTGQATNFASFGGSIVGLIGGPDGALYFLTIGSTDGSVYKITYDETLLPVPPTPTPTPTPTSSFPTATISSPSLGSTYTAGSTIQFSGSGTDPQDGTLSSSAFEWTIVFHHDTHTHPFLGPITAIKSGTFQIPNIGETETSVWYRINLAVVDADGNVSEATRDIKPKKITIKLETVPSGLEVTLDGQPKLSSYSEQSVVGMKRAIGVVSPQIVNGRTLQFRSWSDSGGATHTITTPSSSKTYTATFEDVTPPPPGEVLYPTDDTFVDAGYTSSNYGTKTYLSIDADPLRYSFLKFNLTNLAGTSPSAIFRIKVTAETSKGLQNIWFTTSSNWNQSTVTYTNRPTLNKSVPAIGVIKNNNVPGWMDIDLTSAVRQKVGGIFSIGIDSSSTDGLKFYSKENSIDKPTLIIH